MGEREMCLVFSVRGGRHTGFSCPLVGLEGVGGGSRGEGEYINTGVENSTEEPCWY